MPDTEVTLYWDYSYNPFTPIDIPPHTSTLPGAFKDPSLPNIKQNELQILEWKQTNDLLSMAFCAVQCESRSRLWGFCICTPSCLIERLLAKQDLGTTNDQFISSKFLQRFSWTDYNAFLTMWKAALNESNSPSMKARTMWRIGNPQFKPLTELSKDSKSKSVKSTS